MSFFIREIDQNNEDEIDLVVDRAMETVLETIPEFEGKKENALKIWSNFTFEKMKAMFVKDFDSAAHRIFVIVDDLTKNVVGHAICSYKSDDDAKRYGFCYSRYIHPGFRRQGLAHKLLNEQELWWREKSAEYVIAQTHETNIKLKNLFVQNGFDVKGPVKGELYNYYVLKKYL